MSSGLKCFLQKKLWKEISFLLIKVSQNYFLDKVVKNFLQKNNNNKNNF